MHKEIYLRRHKRHKRQRRIKTIFSTVVLLLLVTVLMGATVKGYEKECQWNDEHYLSGERYGSNNN